MRNRPSYLIPLGWRDGPTLRVPFVERLRTDTMVLPIVERPPNPYEIERIRGTWSRHIPEKAPRYRVSWGRHVEYEVDACRLDAVPISRHILIERPVNRVQRCFENKGLWHGVLYSPEQFTVWTFCDEQVYISLSSEREMTRDRWSERVPTCPSCLAFETAWACYRVFPHQGKKVPRKVENQEKAKERRRARLPTAFDKLLLDDPLDPPVKVRLPPEGLPDPDPTEEFVDLREAKL